VEWSSSLVANLAFTISSYRLTSFVQLGLAQFRQLSPESPLLVSDDRSHESDEIKRISEQYGANYKCSRVRRSHFGGDFQGLVNALAFAEAAGADVGIKVSQRFIFRRPESIEVIKRAFADPNICVATPGQPAKGGAFAKFTTLSDIVAIRVGSITPEDLLQMYRGRLIREKVPWASFIECAVDDLHHSKFPGRTVKMPELTNPVGDPIYLRRYQATEQQYRNLALTHGLNGIYPTNEWGQIEGRRYMCRPVVV
jgi:hypothetical protein